MNIARCCGLAVLIWAADVSIAEAQCWYSLNPTTFTVGGTASTQTLSVISGTSCSWTATTSTSWITITNGTGSGIGSVTFSVAQNATGSPRTGTLTVGGQTVTVNQGTGGCTGTVTPLSFAVDAIASSRTVSVIAGTACSWTATTTTAWITVTAGASWIGHRLGHVQRRCQHDGHGTHRNVDGRGPDRDGQSGGHRLRRHRDADQLRRRCTGHQPDAQRHLRDVMFLDRYHDDVLITVTAGASGSGIGSVTFTIAANTTGSRAPER